MVQDDTGAYVQIPVLIDEHCEVVQPLLDYTLKLKRDGRSLSTINNLIKATQLLLEYLTANTCGFDDPKALFEIFATRLYTGTVDENGEDSSGLYWLPLSRQSARLYIGALTGFTDWMSQQYNVGSINPLIEADTYTQRLNYAAWFRKNQNDFLGHIRDKHVNQTVKYARNVRGLSPVGGRGKDPAAFPERYFQDFFLNGIGGANDPRVAIRDQLILLLMHGAGLRESETLHLWVSDVFKNPHDPDCAMVRIYHPEEGTAPDNWKGRSNINNRAAYLRECYGLGPRTDLMGKKHLGWKSRVYDYMDVHWFPRDYGQLFTVLWQQYLQMLLTVDQDQRHHPYAFISFKRETKGQPYTLNAFNYNYNRGLKRIGLNPCKAEGLSPHGNRHAFGRRLANAKADPIIIQKAFHHASPESQEIYTAPGFQEVSEALDAATLNLDKGGTTRANNDSSMDWEALMRESSYMCNKWFYHGKKI